MWTSHPNFFKVATLKSNPETIVGFVGCAVQNEDTVELARLSVNVDYRGRGIGQFLTRKVLDYARSEGYKNVILETANSQIGAPQLYAKFGFKVVNYGSVCTLANLLPFHGIYIIHYQKEI